MTVYRVSLDNGRFDHVRGKKEALRRAAELVGLNVTPKAVAEWPQGYGVTIQKVGRSTARAVGLA
jgi:hypothetical protein